MGVTFYTTRVLLQVLGVDDYGIYNTIAGIVVLFAFMNNAMVTTTQRFLNFYLGKNDVEKAAASFSVSLIVHMGIGLIVAILAEAIGLWFLYYKMSLPPERFDAAFWTLHLSVAATFVNIVKSPYNACIIAYEKMDFFAYVSIIEAIFKLAIVFILSYLSYDYLITYGILFLVVTITIAYIYKVYCNRHYTICNLRLVSDKAIYKTILRFSFYSLFGNAANVGAQQGVNLMVNSFTSVAVNAAIGVSNQVSQGVYSFITNFQVAFNPILVKMYARNELPDLKRMICQVSRYSFYLMIIISLPLIIYTEEFLSIWLKEVPTYSASFCRLITFTLLIDTVAEPLWKTVQASGDIKTYQIVTSIIILANIPIAYLVLMMGLSPVYIFAVRLLINAIAYAYRVHYVKALVSFEINMYIRHVICPIFFVCAALTAVSLLLYCTISNYILSSLLIFITAGLTIVFCGLNTSERTFVIRVLKSKLKHI